LTVSSSMSLQGPEQLRTSEPTIAYVALSRARMMPRSLRTTRVRSPNGSAGMFPRQLPSSRDHVRQTGHLARKEGHQRVRSRHRYEWLRTDSPVLTAHRTANFRRGHQRNYGQWARPRLYRAPGLPGARSGLSLTEKSLMIAVKNIARRLGDDISEAKPILDSAFPMAAVWLPSFHPAASTGHAHYSQIQRPALLH